MRAWMLVLALVAGHLPPVVARAQEVAASADTDLLSDDELDDLVAPVALYPDSLLAQLFIAATYPLDVMKADRFLDDNPDLADKARADRAEAQDWDESVRVLAGGFPDVVGRMADEIDWTEQVGDAMLAQTDDLLDAVQRMRARAAAAGNLASNDAQTVEVADDEISIAPADPDVVYVPAYDPALAYTTPMAAAPVVYTDPGVSVGDVVTTGAIAFGSALLIDEIFDDDDDWDDYWHGSRVIDWDDDAIARRGDIDVGDIDIDREVNIDRDKVRIGDRDPDARRDRWEANTARRDEARDRIAAREAGRAPRDGGRRSQAEAKLKARSGDGAALEAARARKGEGGGDLAAKRPDRPKDSALKPRPEGKARAAAARDRGAGSLKRDVKPDAVKARAAGASHSKAVAKAKAKSAHRADPPRKPGKKASAFKKSGGHHASSRGHASAGKKLKRR